jgi:hypothetical protein
VLLPNSIKAGAEELGRATAQAAGTNRRHVSDTDYLAFMRKDLENYVDRRQPGTTEDLRKIALNLVEFLTKADEDTQERVADLYVNSYLEFTLATTKREPGGE